MPAAPSSARPSGRLSTRSADHLPPAHTLAAIRIILQTGCRPHEILTAELAWAQPPILLAPGFDLESLADPEAYTRLAPGSSERPRGKGGRLGRRSRKAPPRREQSQLGGPAEAMRASRAPCLDA